MLLECRGALDKAFGFTGLSFLICKMGIVYMFCQQHIIHWETRLCHQTHTLWSSKEFRRSALLESPGWGCEGSKTHRGAQVKTHRGVHAIVLLGCLHNFTIIDKSSWQPPCTLLLSHLLRISHLGLDNRHFKGFLFLPIFLRTRVWGGCYEGTTRVPLPHPDFLGVWSRDEGDSPWE